MKYCVGISTNGFTIMVSERVGAVLKVKEKVVNAVHCPIANHILNLSVAQSSRVQECRHAVDFVTKKKQLLFSTSRVNEQPFLNVIWDMKYAACVKHAGWKDTMVLYKSEPVSEPAFSTWTDTASSSRARILSRALHSSEFLITTVCLSDILECTLPLSRFFQKKK